MRRSDKKIIKKPAAEHNAAPGFLRKITAVFYDALLLLAVLFFATAVALPFNSGQAFSSGQYFYPLYLLTIAFVFYGWFWTHGGQTLGLRAWKIKVCSEDGAPVGWSQAGLRFAAGILSWACIGLGFLWSLFDKNGLCWHDYLSKTRIAWIDQEMR